jgi:phospholipid/cholesterol/gamma-HCH transport system permease protein
MKNAVWSKFSGYPEDVADVFIFLKMILSHTFSTDFEFKEFFYQCYLFGYKTLPLIAITGTIMGLVLTIQSRPVLAEFGAISMLPAMVAVSLIREMGPVITALVCAGKIGSGIGAEISAMKVTEQIDAMELSSTDPVRYLLVTRVLATTVMLPLLVLYADILGIFGSWAGSNIKGDTSMILFFSQAFSHVEFLDFLPALVKTFLFGAVIGLVGCYNGYHSSKGTSGVGEAAHSSVVQASILIIMVDMISVQITDMFL